MNDQIPSEMIPPARKPENEGQRGSAAKQVMLNKAEISQTDVDSKGREKNLNMQVRGKGKILR